MRRLALGLALIGCLLTPIIAEALGFGPINVHTSLNQPLRADIQLSDSHVSNLSNIKVKLASPGLFSRVGIPRPDYLTQLHFKIVHAAHGELAIRVTTRQPMRQPFLDFLVEVNWPGGRLLREYTILLNPPDYMHGKSQASAQMPTVVSQSTSKPSQKTVHPLNKSSTPAQSQSKPVKSAGASHQSAKSVSTIKHYRVAKGDTLWEIAKQDTSVRSGNIDQLMIGILRANPNAFIKRNVNGLKTGYVLRIPSRKQLTSVDSKKAIAEVSRQNALWHRYAMRMAGKTVPESQIKHAGSTASQSQQTSHSGKEVANSSSHLRIMGTEAKSSIRKSASKTQNRNPSVSNAQQKLKHQLALAKEAAVSNGKQIQDLQSRINALQAIVQKQQKLLQLKSQELSKLQSKLKNSQGGAASKSESKSSATVHAKPVQSATKKHEHATPASQSATSTNHSHPTASPKQTPSLQGRITSLILDNPDNLMAIGGVILLLLVLLWLVVRRARGGGKASPDSGIDRGSLNDINISEPQFTPNGGAAATSAATAISTAAGIEERSDSNLDAQNDDADERDVGEDWYEEIPDSHAGEESDRELLSFDENNISSEMGNASDNDVLEEAGVYIAYGLYSQAQDVLQKALETQPDNVDYRAKLAECYYSANDPDRFDKEAHNLLEVLPDADSNPIWQRIAVLGKVLFPDSAIYSQTDTGDLTIEDVINPASTKLEALEPEDADEEVDASALEDVEASEEVNATGEFDSIPNDEELGLDDSDLDEAWDEDESLNLPLEDPSQPASGRESTQVKDNPVVGNDGENLDNPEGLDFDVEDFDVPEGLSSSSEEEAINDLDLDLENLDIPIDDSENPIQADTPDSTSFEDLENLDFDLDFDDEDVATNISNNSAEGEERNLDLEIDQDAVSLESSEHSQSLEASEMDQIHDLDFNLDELDSDSEADGNELITDGDEVATKLDLAKAYIDMGDHEGAKSTLEEVVTEGSPEQREEAETLLKQVGS